MDYDLSCHFPFTPGLYRGYKLDSPQNAGHAHSLQTHVFTLFPPIIHIYKLLNNPDLSSALLSRSESVKLLMNWFVAGDETSEQFVGNATAPDHFRILDKDDFSIIVGGR